MASNIHPCVALRNTWCDGIDTELGANPRLRIYSGTQPTNGDTALGAQVLLADIPLATNPFSAASGGIALLNAAALPAEDTSADATGTATWASFTTSAGVRKLDLSAGNAADSADVTLDNKSIVAGVAVRVVSGQFEMGA